jgi:hypothetical protein
VAGERDKDAERNADGDGRSSDGVLESAVDRENYGTAGLGWGTGAHGGGDNEPSSGQPRTPPPPASHGWLIQVSFVPGW